MSLCIVSDAFLAARVRAGDEAAFEELARRYRPLLRRATARPPGGVDAEDLRQEALLGLRSACAEHRAGRGPFAGYALCRVDWGVRKACKRALRNKHRVLSDAVHDGDVAAGKVVANLPAGTGSDPAVIVELREELRERAHAERERQARRERRPRRCRYSSEEVEHALRLVARGQTIKQVSAAIGAPATTVRGWTQNVGVTATVDRRFFTEAEIEHALGLLEDGATHQQAADAVGATASGVAFWVRRTGRRGNGRRRAYGPDEVRHALALVDDSASAKHAAAAIGASASAVRRWQRDAA